MTEPQPHDLERDLRVGGADRHLVQTDAVVAVKAEPVVAGQYEDEAAGDRVTIHHGDRRLWKRQQPYVHVAKESRHHHDLFVVAPRRGQIEASGEELAGPRQHDRSNGGIGARPLGRREQVGEQRLVLRVRGRSIQYQPAHSSRPILDPHGTHRRTPFRPRLGGRAANVSASRIATSVRGIQGDNSARRC